MIHPKAKLRSGDAQFAILCRWRYAPEEAAYRDGEMNCKKLTAMVETTARMSTDQQSLTTGSSGSIFNSVQYHSCNATRRVHSRI